MNEHRNNGPEPDEAGQTGSATAAAQTDVGAEAEGVNDAESPADGEEEVCRLQSELAEAQAELDRHREAMLRIQAETENQRKRMAREMDRSRQFALERMMKDLLQVHDSLERGLEVDSESATVEGLREGKALTLRMLSKVLEDHGLEVVDPVGQPFNPEWHEAMTTAPSAEHDENTVIEVLQKGFKLHERLIRPARVVVSRKPE